MEDPNEIFVPVLHHFENTNVFTGSFGALRFILEPDPEPKKGDDAPSLERQIHARVWYGQFCLEKSEIADAADFPLTEEGRAALKAWLDAHRKEDA